MQFALVFFGLFCLALAEVPLHRALTVDERVENEYIVSFLKGVNKDDIVEFMTDNVKMGIEVETFQIHDWQGAYVTLSPEQLEHYLQQEHILEFVSENRVYHVAQCSRQTSPEWNLERVSEKTLYLGNSQGYKYPPNSANTVTSYIIDTGIYDAHNDFGGRASFAFNGIDANNNDCHGHGTHVAGIVGGSNFGIAKSVQLRAVKVLNCQGSGTSASVIRGIQYVAGTTQRPANANMSLGGGNDPAMIAAVNACVASGVVVVVAAGNSNTNACNFSPANSPSAITVVSTTVEPVQGSPTDEQEDVRSSFSNYGNCCHVAAPGTLINAPWIGSPQATRVLSGTSMASPHVCGVVSLLQAAPHNCGSPANCKQMVTTVASTPNIIDLACTNAVCNQTPNLLVYSGDLC